MEIISSPNYTLASQSQAVYGRARTFEAIVIHWWDDPTKRPSIEGVISTFLNRNTQVSAHYVINNSRTIRMVSEDHIAWHARHANPFTIGIECDPNGGDAMYERIGVVVKDIRKRRGNLPLKPHSAYVQTACPGNISLSKINTAASGGTINMDSTDGTALYQTGLFREPENARVAGQWNGLKPAEAMRRLRTSKEWQEKRDKLANYHVIVAENAELKKKVEDGGKSLSDYDAQDLFNELVKRSN